MYLFVFAIVAIVVLWGVSTFQNKNAKKGRFVSNKMLLTRSRWAIYLAGLSMFSFLISISNQDARNNEQDILNSIRLDTLSVKYWELIPIRMFNEGVYSRKELDILELDYRRLYGWMNDKKQSLHAQMNNFELIDTSILDLPNPISPVATYELDYYRESFLEALNEYNQDARKYQDCRKQINFLVTFSFILDYVIPLCLLISMVLQLNVVFWTFRKSEKNE